MKNLPRVKPINTPSQNHLETFGMRKPLVAEPHDKPGFNSDLTARFLLFT